MQQAIDVVGRAFLTPGDRVAVEDPGYQPPRWLLDSLGARVIGVPVDDDGLVVDALPRVPAGAYDRSKFRTTEACYGRSRERGR